MCIYMCLPGVLLFVQLSFWLHGSLLLSGISLVAVSRGCSAAVHRPLCVVVSPAAERGLSSVGLVAVGVFVALWQLDFSRARD